MQQAPEATGYPRHLLLSRRLPPLPSPRGPPRTCPCHGAACGGWRVAIRRQGADEPARLRGGRRRARRVPVPNGLWCTGRARPLSVPPSELHALRVPVPHGRAARPVSVPPSALLTRMRVCSSARAPPWACAGRLVSVRVAPGCVTIAVRCIRCQPWSGRTWRQRDPTPPPPPRSFARQSPGSTRRTRT
jgi:hypothetical protein